MLTRERVLPPLTPRARREVREFARLLDQPVRPGAAGPAGSGPIRRAPAGSELPAPAGSKLPAPAGSSELAALAELARSLPVLPVRPSEAFRAQLRERLVQVAEQPRSAVDERAELDTRTGAVAPLPRPALLRRRGRNRSSVLPGRGPRELRLPLPGPRWRMLGAAAAVLLATGASLVAASSGALPGDRLYGLKRSVEDVRLALAGSDPARAQVLLQDARARLGEAETLLRRPSAGSPAGVRELAVALTGLNDEMRRGGELDLAAAGTGRGPAALSRLAGFLGAVQPRLQTLQPQLPAGAGGQGLAAEQTAAGLAGELSRAISACGQACAGIPVPAVPAGTGGPGVTGSGSGVQPPGSQQGAGERTGTGTARSGAAPSTAPTAAPTGSVGASGTGGGGVSASLSPLPSVSASASVGGGGASAGVTLPGSTVTVCLPLPLGHSC